MDGSVPVVAERETVPKLPMGRRRRRRRRRRSWNPVITTSV
jgi:hypothetical protein